MAIPGVPLADGCCCSPNAAIRKILVCCLLTLLPAGSVAAQPVDASANRNHFLPLFADGEGLRTFLFVTNVSPTANRCLLGLRGSGLNVSRLEAHAQVSLAASWASMELPAAGDTVLLQSAGERTLAFGYGVMECAGPVAVRSLLSLEEGDSSLALTNAENTQTAENFQLPLLPAWGQLSLLFSNDTDSEVLCTAGLKNAEGEAVSSGDVFASPRSVLWQPVEDFLVIPEGVGEGRVTLECDRKLGLLALSRSGPVFSVWPPVPLDDELFGQSSALLPLVADGGGFHSQLLITNLTEAPNRCRMKLRGAGLDGSRFLNWPDETDGASAVLELQRRGEQQSLISTHVGQLAFGYASLRCDGPVEARNLLSTSLGGTLTGMASIAAAQPTHEFEFPVAPVAGRLALVLSNEGSDAGSCTVQWRGLAGATGVRQELVVPGQTTTVRFLADLFGPRPAGFAGGLAALDCDAAVGALALPLGEAAFAALPPVIFSAASGVSGSVPTFGNLPNLDLEIYAVNEAIFPLQLPTASGGDGPLRYSLQPQVPGLRFDPATRLLSGTPTVADYHLMNYRVQDVDGDSDVHQFEIWIEEPDSSPKFLTTVRDQAYRLNQVIQPLQLPAVAGGNQPVEYALASLVPGLFFDQETRQLKGTPLRAGRYEIEYLAFDSDLDTDTLRFVLTVSVPILDSSYRQSSGCADGTFVDDPEANPGLVADCRALVGFANGLISNGLHARDNVIRQWGRGDQQKIDAWRGIGLANGRVDRVSLEFSDLQGDLSSGLGQLSALRVLDLSNNALTGSIPPELGKLSGLESLRLALNQLSGPIPSELGQLSQLTLLDLSSNDLSGDIPSELGHLNQLTSLDLGENGLSGPIPPELGQLGQLTSLDLSSNDLSGGIPVELGQLRQLKWLDLEENGLTGPIPPGLGQLDQLTWLDLGYNQLGGTIPATLQRLVQLEFLHLSHNRLTGMLPPGLGDLDGLKLLDISFNPLQGKVPWRFRERILSGVLSMPLRGTLISGFGPSPESAPPPVYGRDAAGNGNASHQSTAYFQGPLVLEWSGQGQQVEYQTPILGRWAALAVRVTHGVRAAPHLVTRVLDPRGKVLAANLDQVIPAVTERVDSGDWQTEYLFHMPGALVQAGNQVVHVIDPDNELPQGNRSDNRSEPFVVYGEQPPPFRATFVPMGLAGAEETGWSEGLDPDQLMSGTLAMLPVADDFDVQMGTAFTAESESIDDALFELFELWNLQADPDEFYHGITTAPVGGIALLEGRVAISTLSVHDVIPHEFGHNFNLRHTPGCTALGVDRHYPLPDGQLGLLPAWDPTWLQFVSGETGKRVDVMSYCGSSVFISAYNYRLASRYWLDQRGGGAKTTQGASGVKGRVGSADLSDPGLVPAGSSAGAAGGGALPADLGRGGGQQAGSRQTRSTAASLALTGRIDADGTWSLTQAQLSDRSPRPPQGDGTYTLILLGQGGLQLYAEPLRALPLSDSLTSLWAARLPLPSRPAYALVIVDDQNQVLLRQALPALD